MYDGHPSTELFFIQDKAYRAISERDLASLAFDRKHHQVKSALIMAGSVIEAALQDCNLRLPPAQVEEAARRVQAQRSADPRFNKLTEKHWNKWSFIHHIAVSGPEGLGILRGRTERVADTLRDFRNLVHPARERQEFHDSPLRPSDAEAAETFTRMVLEDIKEWARGR